MGRKYYIEVSKVQIIENKNKYHLIIRAKGNEYLYKTNQKIVNMF